MYTVLNVSFFLTFLYFLAAVFLAFFIPGSLLLKRLKLPLFPQILISIVLGMGMWGMQGFIFGSLHMRFASYIYLAVFFLLWVYSHAFLRSFHKISLKFKIRNLDFLLVVMIGIGMLLQLAGVWLVGIRFADGVFFCCSHILDNILEIAIINQVVKNFPPMEPGMYGVPVQNYHYWSHLVIGETVRVFHLPLVAASYQYFTVLLSLLLGLLAIAIGRQLQIGKSFTRWFVFFLYFGGDFAYLLFFFLGKGFIFPISSMENGTQFLLNYPRAFAVIIFLTGLFLLIRWIQKKEMYTGFLAAFLLAITIGFKVYIGLFALSGLGFLLLYYLLKKRFTMIPPITSAFLLGLIIYLPVNENAGGLFYTGFWRVENFIVLPSLGLTRMYMAKEIYAHNNNILRVIQYDLIFTFIFLFNTFGTKLLGCVQSRKSLSRVPLELHIFLIPAMILSMVVGLFFWQKVGGANTFNFLVTVIIISSFYAALSCFHFLLKMNTYIKFIFIVLIVALTIPRALQAGLVENYKSVTEQYIHISNKELSALDYLRTKTDPASLVLVDPHIAFDMDTPYVSYLGDRYVFLSGRGNELEAHGIDYSGRAKIVEAIMNGKNKLLVKKELTYNQIQYLYLLSSTKLPLKKIDTILTPVFKNHEIVILKVLP